MNEKIRYTFSPDKTLPLYIDSIGYNPQELDFNRPEGYPYYHWLQTIEGEGVLEFASEKYVLKQGQGILLTPYTPHMYHPNYKKTYEWSTFYLTFSGAAIDSILSALNMNFSAVYEESEVSLFYRHINKIFHNLEDNVQTNLMGYDLSTYLYTFLMLLKKYGKLNNRLSTLQSFEKIRYIVEWLEQVYPENIGLHEISEKADVSSQHLNKLFHDTFGMSPYSFLVQLRIREAKRLLLTDPDLTLKDLSQQVGFNGVSHFVSTFKKREGITPKQYRDLHLNNHSFEGGV